MDHEGLSFSGVIVKVCSLKTIFELKAALRDGVQESKRLKPQYLNQTAINNPNGEKERSLKVPA